MALYEPFRTHASNERVPMPSYERLRALEMLILEGQADRPAIFELFTRHLDPDYDAFTVTGIHETIEQLLRYSYTQTQIEHMSEFVSLETIDYLSDYRFRGSLFGLKEGSLAFPFTPILTAHCTVAEGVLAAALIETVMTREINTATACAHITKQVGAVPTIDNFSYRESDITSALTSKTAYLAGFTATTNLKGSLNHSIPVYDIGTRAHFPMFGTEKESYRLLHKYFNDEATYLINTDDIAESITRAAHASEGKMHAVRLETAHYENMLPAVREHLDIIGMEGTRIVLSGNFNHHDATKIRERNLPVDVLICNQNPHEATTSRQSPFTFDIVALEQDGIYVSTENHGDENSVVFGGVKTPHRNFNDDWEMCEEHLTPNDSLQALQNVDLEALQEIYIKKGALHQLPNLTEARNLYNENSTKTVATDMKTTLNGTIIWER